MSTKKKFASGAKQQCSRLLQALQEAQGNGITTIQAREDLDIMMPASRVHELRHEQGYNIKSISSFDTNAQGNSHSCYRYVLMSGKWDGRKDS